MRHFNKLLLGLLLVLGLCIQPQAKANSVVEKVKNTSIVKEKNVKVLKVTKALKPAKLLLKAKYIQKESRFVMLEVSSSKNYGIQGTTNRLRITPLYDTESVYNYAWEVYDIYNNIIASGYGYRYVPEWATNIHAYIAGNETFSDSGGLLIVVIDDEEDD